MMKGTRIAAAAIAAATATTALGAAPAEARIAPGRYTLTLYYLGTASTGSSMGQYKAWVTGNWMAIRDRSNRHRIRPTRAGGEIVGPRVRYVFRKAARGYTGEVYQNGAFTNQLTLIRP